MLLLCVIMANGELASMKYAEVESHLIRTIVSSKCSKPGISTRFRWHVRCYFHSLDCSLKMKYVLVTGGVVSGLGKGVTASSVGVLLKACGHRVTHIKIDPYLNVDAGTMSPFEHGEVFVLDDGGEADLDLGNYERFVDITLTRDNNLTTGKAYASVIERERKGEYLGKTVQVVPHITDEIQDWIERVSHTPVDGTSRLPSVCVIELGGTVGDIESMPFLEALRQFQFRVGPKNMCVIHVSLVPVLGVVGEQKTKPTQHSVQVRYRLSYLK